MVLIFKVMVCFLAVFSSEDYVGGLPSIQDSPDNHQAGQSARSASNQGVTNEPGSHPADLLDYAERHEEVVERKVNREIEKKIGAGCSSVKIGAEGFEDRSIPCLASEIIEAIERLKFSPDAPTKNEKLRKDALPKGSSGTDQWKPFNDKSKSRNDQATSSEFLTDPTDPTSSHGTERTQRFSSVYAMVDSDKKAENSENLDNLRGGETLLSKKTDVPKPEEESKTQTTDGQDDLEQENRRRKSVGDVVTWHQQSTNMRPTRTQHLVQNKRSPSEGNVLKLPGYGGRRNVAKNGRAVGARLAYGSNRRHYAGEGPSQLRGNQLQFTGLNPVQINAAIAYSNRQPPPQALNVDLSRALYQFGPAQLHALRGVFDKVPPSTQNFKPIAPKQVAYAPPRIVYETKIVPTPFMPFGTEQKTVDALSALLGQHPAQQLQGLNLILAKDRPEKSGAKTPSPTSPAPKISRQDIHESVALNQAFVTPIPSIDINTGLADGSYGYSHDREPSHEDITATIEAPFDQKSPEYSLQENIALQENNFKSIPVVEVQEQTQLGQSIEEKDLQPVWNGAQDPEITAVENEGRYNHQLNQEIQDHDEGYAAKYRFGYHVKDYESGNDFGHEEARDGLITNGRYHVLLPDGRIQNVKYHVDEGGYHAKVSYRLNPTH